MRLRQRVLDEYHPRSVRVIEVFQHGQVVPVPEDRFKTMRKAESR